jgi:hypothetical protein
MLIGWVSSVLPLCLTNHRDCGGRALRWKETIPLGVTCLVGRDLEVTGHTDPWGVLLAFRGDLKVPLQT